MGLANFDERSARSSYCSSSTVDRSLTISLIESSDCPLRSSSRFAHTPDWADGLDLWSLSSPSIRPSNKNDGSRRTMDFHRELGLFLPRHEKPSSAPISLKATPILQPKVTSNPFTPERLRHLLRKEKDLLLQTDLSNQQLIFESSLPPPPVPINSLRQSTSLDLRSSDEVSFPLRHLPSHDPSSSQPSLTPSLNPDALKSLLKEHLTSLLTRGASTVQTHRPVNILPLEEMKEPTNVRMDNKPLDSSTYFAQHRSTLGLTVTPLELSTTMTKNYQSISLEKMAQQRNCLQDNESVSSQATSRPSTQPIIPAPVPVSTLIHPYQAPRFLFKRTIETRSSPSTEIGSTNDRPSEQHHHVQTIRKVPLHQRSTSKTGLQRNTTAATIELLPPIISGKRLHIPLANHRYL